MVSSVHTAIKISAEIVGRPSRTKMISEPQQQLLLDKLATEADPVVKIRLLSLRGILQPDFKDTGTRLKDFTPDSDRITWSKRLIRLFALAGIKSVRNEVGRIRKPHTYMLRDTFAVWNLRHGVPLHALAAMMGHKNPATTARSYLPFVSELEASTIAEGRAALAKARKSGMPDNIIKMVKK